MSAKLDKSNRKAGKALGAGKAALLVLVASAFGAAAVGASSEGGAAEDNGPVTIAQTDTAALMQLVAAGRSMTARLAAPMQLFQPNTVSARSSCNPIWRHN